jgi:hypothetical protein
MVHPETGDVYDIPVEHVNDAQKRGLKPGVDMLSPKGEPYTIPADQAEEAQKKHGFQKKVPANTPAYDVSASGAGRDFSRGEYLMKQPGESDAEFMARATQAGRSVTPEQIKTEHKHDIKMLPYALAAGPAMAVGQTMLSIMGAEAVANPLGMLGVLGKSYLGAKVGEYAGGDIGGLGGSLLGNEEKGRKIGRTAGGLIGGLYGGVGGKVPKIPTLKGLAESLLASGEKEEAAGVLGKVSEEIPVGKSTPFEAPKPSPLGSVSAKPLPVKERIPVWKQFDTTTREAMPPRGLSTEESATVPKGGPLKAIETEIGKQAGVPQLKPDVPLGEQLGKPLGEVGKPSELSIRRPDLTKVERQFAHTNSEEALDAAKGDKELMNQIQKLGNDDVAKAANRLKIDTGGAKLKDLREETIRRALKAGHSLKDIVENAY